LRQAEYPDWISRAEAGSAATARHSIIINGQALNIGFLSLETTGRRLS
jgi:hypothetical protein